MKKTLFIIGFILAVLFSYGQKVELRVQDDGNKRKMPSISVIHPLFNIPLNEAEVTQVSFPEPEIWFYPEQLTWIDLSSNPVKQGGALPGSVKYIEITDKNMNIGLKQITRIMEGQEVQENRIISVYDVTIHFVGGEDLKLRGVKIVANNDNHVPIPGYVPGSRWLFTSSKDDISSVWSVGGMYSSDGGLDIDHD